MILFQMMVMQFSQQLLTNEGRMEANLRETDIASNKVLQIGKAIADVESKSNQIGSSINPLDKMRDNDPAKNYGLVDDKTMWQKMKLKALKFMKEMAESVEKKLDRVRVRLNGDNQKLTAKLESAKKGREKSTKNAMTYIT